MDRLPARSRRVPRSVREAKARFLAAMTERFPEGSPSAERRMIHAADRVHRMVDATTGEPTDDSVRGLERAYRGLTQAARAARAAGVPERRVDAVVEPAHTACVRLLIDDLVPLVGLHEVPPDERSA